MKKLSLIVLLFCTTPLFSTYNKIEIESFNALKDNTDKIEMHKFYTPTEVRKLANYDNRNFSPFGSMTHIKKYAHPFYLYSTLYKPQLVYSFEKLYEQKDIRAFYMFSSSQRKSNKNSLLNDLKEKTKMDFKNGHKGIYFFSKEQTLELAKNALIEVFKELKIDVSFERKELSQPISGIEKFRPFETVDLREGGSQQESHPEFISESYEIQKQVREDTVVGTRNFNHHEYIIASIIASIEEDLGKGFFSIDANTIIRESENNNKLNFLPLCTNVTEKNIQEYDKIIHETHNSLIENDINFGSFNVLHSNSATNEIFSNKNINKRKKSNNNMLFENQKKHLKLNELSNKWFRKNRKIMKERGILQEDQNNRDDESTISIEENTDK